MERCCSGAVCANRLRLPSNQWRSVQRPTKRFGRAHFRPCSDSLHEHNANGRSGSSGPTSRLKPVKATSSAPVSTSCEQDVIDAQSELLSMENIPSHIAAGTANLHQLTDLVAALSDVTSELEVLGSLEEDARGTTDTAGLTVSCEVVGNWLRWQAI
jgi:hypothetical protein